MVLNAQQRTRGLSLVVGLNVKKHCMFIRSKMKPDLRSSSHHSCLTLPMFKNRDQDPSYADKGFEWQ